VSEYGIKNDSRGGDSIRIDCGYDHTYLHFSVGGKDPKPGVSVVINIGADEWSLRADREGNISTISHSDSSNYYALWAAMRAGKIMRVRFGTGESTVFSLVGASKALPRTACLPDFAR
jgi:hypothetical protein